MSVWVLKLGVTGFLLFLAGAQSLRAQPVGAGTEAHRAEEQRRYEQERAFDDHARAMESQARFLSVHGFPEGYALSSTRYVSRLSRPVRESFVSFTTLAAPPFLNRP